MVTFDPDCEASKVFKRLAQDAVGEIDRCHAKREEWRAEREAELAETMRKLKLKGDAPGDSRATCYSDLVDSAAFLMRSLMREFLFHHVEHLVFDLFFLQLLGRLFFVRLLRRF